MSDAGGLEDGAPRFGDTIGFAAVSGFFLKGLACSDVLLFFAGARTVLPRRNPMALDAAGKSPGPGYHL